MKERETETERERERERDGERDGERDTERERVRERERERELERERERETERERSTIPEFTPLKKTLSSIIVYCFQSSEYINYYFNSAYRLKTPNKSRISNI